MALSRSERFHLKSQVVERLRQDPLWDFDRQNLLLTEFGFDRMYGDYDSPDFAQITSSIGDSDLLEMYRVVLGENADLDSVGEKSSLSENWKPGYVRLFLSHSAVHREFVADVANELAVVGIHGFVAHDTMTYSQPWQAQIEDALRSMQAFVALVHPEFNESKWCLQEVGWALGRSVPVYFIRMGADPAGFAGRDQWPSGVSRNPKEVSTLITEWVSAIPDLGAGMVEGLLSALREVNNYIDAGAAANRVATLADLTEDQWLELDAAYWANDQVNGGVLATRALRPFYRAHGKEWPPVQPGA